MLQNSSVKQSQIRSFYFVIFAIVLIFLQTYIRMITRMIIFISRSNNHSRYDYKHIESSTKASRHGWPVLEQHQWCSTGHPWRKASVVFHNRGFSNRYTGELGGRRRYPHSVWCAALIAALCDFKAISTMKLFFLPGLCRIRSCMTHLWNQGPQNETDNLVEIYFV